jgi:hypothetical protein
MLKTINWNVIQNAHKRIVTEHSLEPKTVIYFGLLTEDGESQTKKFYFEDFLKIMWKIFDSPRSFKKIIISKDKEGKDIIYTYEGIPIINERRPDDYNTDVIKLFKNMTQTSKNLYIDLLIKQIMEDNNAS